MTVTPPAADNPIVKADGRMHQFFRAWAQEISRADIIVGTGSPEGVVEAVQRRQYMDDAGLTGSILYIKRDSDIAGDRSKGWILV